MPYKKIKEWMRERKDKRLKKLRKLRKESTIKSRALDKKIRTSLCWLTLLGVVLFHPVQDLITGMSKGNKESDWSVESIPYSPQPIELKGISCYNRRLKYDNEQELYAIGYVKIVTRAIAYDSIVVGAQEYRELMLTKSPNESDLERNGLWLTMKGINPENSLHVTTETIVLRDDSGASIPLSSAVKVTGKLIDPCRLSVKKIN